MEERKEETTLKAAVEYLRDCSDAEIELFELARLNTSANLMQDLKRLMEQTIKSTAEALLANTIREYRKSLTGAPAPFRYAEGLMAEISSASEQEPSEQAKLPPRRKK